jgi:hypothetical protein
VLCSTYYTNNLILRSFPFSKIFKVNSKKIEVVLVWQLYFILVPKNQMATCSLVFKYRFWSYVPGIYFNGTMFEEKQYQTKKMRGIYTFNSPKPQVTYLQIIKEAIRKQTETPFRIKIYEVMDLKNFYPDDDDNFDFQHCEKSN